MIMIGALKKGIFIFKWSSSTRDFSTVECSLVQLSADIHFVYTNMIEERDCIPSAEYDLLHQRIVTGRYILSPLQMKFILKKDLNKFLLNTQADYPGIMLGVSPYDPVSLCVIMPDKKDVFVYMGFSIMLYRFTYGRLPNDGFRFESELDSFYNSLQEIGKVDRVYKLDLKKSLRTIPIRRILDIMKPLVGDDSVFKLISSFLSLSIIDEDGNNCRSDSHIGGIPPLGEITRVLFNIVLMDIFDREFPKRFPGIAFVRFLHEVYIFTRGNDEVIFDEKAGYALLEELSLQGKIESTGQYDDPLYCYYNKILYVDIYDCDVQVCDPADYY